MHGADGSSQVVAIAGALSGAAGHQLRNPTLGPSHGRARTRWRPAGGAGEAEGGVRGLGLLTFWGFEYMRMPAGGARVEKGSEA